MENKKLIRFVESLILLPITMMSMPLGGVTQAGYQAISDSKIVLSQKLNTGVDDAMATNAAIDQKLRDQSAKAAAIDAYFESHNMPLYGTGLKMVQEAEKNGLDWRLVAAIAVRESTGGRQKCVKVPNNPFGWGSCKIGFKSTDAAIETVARNLGGNNPRTAFHYGNKTTMQILQAYNPPSIVARYAHQVINIMNDMGDEVMADSLAVNS